MGKNGNLIVGLDLGTTKTCAIVGELSKDGIDIIGFGSAPSKGLKKGMIINIESTADSIGKVVEEAELMAGCRISGVYTGIAGNHIRGTNSHGVIGIKDHEVGKKDISRVIEAAKAIAIPIDREVIHVLPQEFIVDEQDGIHDPLGMSGVRLEAKVHMVTGTLASAQNIIKCANRNGLTVKELVLQSLASSESTLEADERELGVALVDIGGGTTDTAIFQGGSIRYTSVLPLGGNHLTSDIAVGLKIPLKQAEELKLQYGCASTGVLDSKDDTIEITCMGGKQPRKVSRRFLCQIIQSRIEEIFNLLNREIVKSGYRELIASGVVLTGGTALLDGITDIGERILDLPVRVGYPNSVGGLSEIVKSPMYATAVGLILFGRTHAADSNYQKKNGSMFTKFTHGVKNWFAEAF
jgi:cell division protein FtsA